MDVVPLTEICVVVFGYTTGPLVRSRSLASLPSVGVIAASLAVAAVAYAPVAAFEIPAHVRLDVALSVAGLAVVCTAVAFLVFFELIAAIGPARATVITYVNPAVAAALGVAILGEPFTVRMGVGFGLVLTGSVLATTARRRVRDGPVPLVEAAPR
ncbi:MAG: DMT family transporter [Acidobacteriota bacterium]|nr:DMT family transporter [Acidobacteriota bacterium]